MTALFLHHQHGDLSGPTVTTGTVSSSLCLCGYGTCPWKPFLGSFRYSEVHIYLAHVWPCRNDVMLSHPGTSLSFPLSFLLGLAMVGQGKRLSKVQAGEMLVLLESELRVTRDIYSSTRTGKERAYENTWGSYLSTWEDLTNLCAGKECMGRKIGYLLDDGLKEENRKPRVQISIKRCRIPNAEMGAQGSWCP